MKLCRFVNELLYFQEQKTLIYTQSQILLCNLNPFMKILQNLSRSTELVAISDLKTSTAPFCDTVIRLKLLNNLEIFALS